MIRQCKKPREPETVQFAPLFSERSCRGGVCSVSVGGELCASPEIAFAGLVREERGEVCVSTRTAEEKWELVRAKQKEIRSNRKHTAFQAATRSGVHPTALMRMRWVLTQKPDSSLKARLVVLGFADPQLGAKPTASLVSRHGTTLLECGRITGHASVQSRCKVGFCCSCQEETKNFIVNPLQNCHKRWAWNATNAYNYEIRCTA